MANYIVVRIVPQTPVDAVTFANDYLAPLGGLTITAYQLDFATAGSQPAGPSIGSVAYNAITPAGFWGADGATPANYVSAVPPPYPAGTTTGLIQQVDFGFDSKFVGRCLRAPIGSDGGDRGELGPTARKYPARGAMGRPDDTLLYQLL